MRIGIFYLENNGIEETARELAVFLTKRNVKVIDTDNLKKLRSAKGLIIISLGGDGTFLKASHIGIRLNAPVVGVNLGNLGFLTDIEARDLFDATEQLLKGKYEVEKRMTLEGTVIGAKGEEKTFIAVNDFIVQRKIDGKILSTEIYVNGMDSGRFRSDGLVVATPTGSTAYSLSVGGPIISPLSEVYSFVFIAPHKLSARPVVLSGSDKLSVRMLTEGTSYLLRDGEIIATLEKFDRILFKKSGKYLQILHLKNKNFFEVLNKKFGWGV